MWIKAGVGLMERSPTERDLGVLVMARSIGASSVPWEPAGQNASRGAANTAQAASQKKGLSCCIQCLCSPTSSPVCSSGPHNLTRMEGIPVHPEGGNKSGERAGRNVP